MKKFIVKTISKFPFLIHAKRYLYTKIHNIKQRYEITFHPKIRNINRTFIVLGAPRSGTSLTAGGLKKMGIDMGKKLAGKTIVSPNGYFENIEITKLNNKILNKAGGSWLNPPSEKAILKAGEDLKDEIKTIVNKHKSKLWGWKDPRTTLTIKCYWKYLEHPFVISCFRSPEDVATSLTKKCGWIQSYDEALKLAKEYDKRLLNFLKQYR